MTPPLLFLLQSVLIEGHDEQNPREVTSLIQCLGWSTVFFSTVVPQAFGDANRVILLLCPEDHPLCSNSTRRIIYPETINESKRMKRDHFISTQPSKWTTFPWDHYAEIIIRKLESMSIDWASVEGFESEGERDGVMCTQFTIVITVYTLPTVNWEFLRLLGEFHSITEARIEICVGRVVRHGGVEDDSLLDQTFLPPGSDVSFHSAVGECTGGTIGGIIELVDDHGTSQRLCGLTCRSVLPFPLLAPDTGVESDSTRVPLERYRTITCSYPNNSLWRQKIRAASKELNRLRTEIEQIENSWNRDWEPIVVAEQNLYLQSKKNEGYSRKQVIFGDSLSIGTVCAYSGTRASENHHLDWALVDLEAVKNLLYRPNTIRESFTFSQIKMPPISTQTLKPGSAVYKAKYPDTFAGYVSYTKSYVRYKDGKSGEVKIEKEWAVIPAPGYKSFCESKDCGAWVINRIDHTVAGVIYAMNTGTGVAYITPIREIFDDIEKDTGSTVRLPGEVGCQTGELWNNTTKNGLRLEPKESRPM